MDDAPMVPLVWHERAMEQMRDDGRRFLEVAWSAHDPSFLNAPRSA